MHVEFMIGKVTSIMRSLQRSPRSNDSKDGILTESINSSAIPPLPTTTIFLAKESLLVMSVTLCRSLIPMTLGWDAIVLGWAPEHMQSLS